MQLIALGPPYHSPFLGAWLAATQVPVLDCDAGAVPFADRFALVGLDELARRCRSAPPRLLTTLEGCLPALTARFPDWPALRAAELCKDKARFRAATAALFPGLRVERLVAPTRYAAAELRARPRVAKPVRGISSTGVRVLDGADGDVVVDASPATPVLVEDRIDGTELAIDGWFDAAGAPVVLAILQHDFAGADDVADTLYHTSRALMRRHLAGVVAALTRLNGVLGLRDFPFHYEVRHDPARGYLPIEMNPLRFAGYGTCEIAWWAYGINPYAAFLADAAPDWATILADGDGAVFGVVCLEHGRADLRAIAAIFAEVLDLRVIADPTAAAEAMVLFRVGDRARLAEYAALNRPALAEAR